MNGAAAPSPRRHVYALLITVAAAAVAGRIFSAERVYEPSLARAGAGSYDYRAVDRRSAWPATRPEPMPTFSSNDRSRWATIRALVEQGTYAIGRRDEVSPVVGLLAARGPYQALALAEVAQVNNFRYDSGIIFLPGYESVDKVLDPGTLEFYSSKPPLLSTLLAGEYWVLHRLGWSMGEYPWLVVEVIVLTVHWLPLLIYLILLARLLERFGRSDWGRYYVLAAACFATLVTHFAISVNNHVLATCLAVFALYPGLLIWLTPGGSSGWWGGRLAAWMGAGTGAAREGAASPPARSLFVLAGFFAAFAACTELPALAFLAGLFALLLLWFPGRTLLYFVPAAAVPIAAFFVTNYLAVGQLRPIQSQFNSPWYNYPGSHWNPNQPEEKKHGIDWARLYETRADYAFNVFVGHHGLFSLSPIYLLSVAGMVAGLVRGRRKKEPPLKAAGEEGGLPWVIYPLTIYLSVVVTAFYLVATNNYGGWTSGLRWLMWLIPFWLLTMLPVVDRAASRRWVRVLAYLFLAVSVFSVSYREWNPWRMPWLYDLMQWLGWKGY